MADGDLRRFELVWDLLADGLSPRDTLRIMPLAEIAEACRDARDGDPHWWTRPMCLMIHSAERLGAAAWRVRAACLLTWGRPSYAGRGALTLCEPGAEGRLSLAHEHELELV